MGWFLWGVTFGWAVCAFYYSSQTKSEEADNGAMIIGVALGIVALIITISISVSSGAIPAQMLPTPTSLGR